MFLYFKKIISGFSLIMLISFSAFLPLNYSIAADPTIEGLEDTVKQTPENGLIKLKPGEGPEIIAGKIIGTVLSFIGVLFFLLIIYGGLRWMMAQGNDTEVDKAKQIIIAATSGLIIVLAAYAITSFIGSRLANS